MNEKVLNEAINELNASQIWDDNPAIPWRGKPIPYIGWYWRYVHFDTDGAHTLGVIPAGADRNSMHLVAFMENNKWDYPEFDVKEPEWSHLRDVIKVAVISPSIDTIRAVFDTLQGLLPDDTKDICDNWSSPYRYQEE